MGRVRARIGHFIAAVVRAHVAVVAQRRVRHARSGNSRCGSTRRELTRRRGHHRSAPVDADLQHAALLRRREHRERRTHAPRRVASLFRTHAGIAPEQREPPMGLHHVTTLTASTAPKPSRDVRMEPPFAKRDAGGIRRALDFFPLLPLEPRPAFIANADVCRLVTPPGASSLLRFGRTEPRPQLSTQARLFQHTLVRFRESHRAVLLFTA